MIGLFALGLMSKPMLVTLPLVLVLLDYWPLGRMSRLRTAKVRDFRGAEGDGRFRGAKGARISFAERKAAPFARLVLEKVPLLLLTAGPVPLTAAGGRQRRHLALHRAFFPSRRGLPTCLVSYAAYLRQFFCPVGLAVIYPWQDVDLPPWKVVGAVLILAAVTAAAVVCRRSRPYFLVGWLWYLGMLAPVTGLMQVGEQAMADRFTYLPQIGLCHRLDLGDFR